MSKEQEKGVIKVQEIDSYPDFEAVFGILKELHGRGFPCPKPIEIHVDEEQGIKELVVEYIPGQRIMTEKYGEFDSDIDPYAVVGFVDEFCWSQLPIMGMRLDSGLLERLGPPRDWWYFASRFGDHVRVIGDHTFGDELEVLSRASRVCCERLSVYRDSRMVLQHGDVYGYNIVKTDSGDLFFIDWDRITISTRWYDVSTFIAKSLVNIDALVQLSVDLERRAQSESELVSFRLQLMYAVVKEYRNVLVADIDPGDLVISKFMDVARRMIIAMSNDILAGGNLSSASSYLERLRT